MLYIHICIMNIHIYIYIKRKEKFTILTRRNEMRNIYFIFTRIYAHKITDIRKLNQLP